MRFLVAFGAVLAITAVGATAEAQENGGPYLFQHVSAPIRAFELQVGTGYAQGIGMLAPARTVSDASGAGLGASVGLGARIDASWSLGMEGQYQEFVPNQDSWARSLALDVGVTYHFLPVTRGDPWLRLATGYRLFYESQPAGQSGGTWTQHGFELLGAKLGYDVRISEEVALAPVLGADLNLFVWEDPANPPNHVMPSSEVATLVYAGLQGRFDIAGQVVQ